MITPEAISRAADAACSSASSATNSAIVFTFNTLQILVLPAAAIALAMEGAGLVSCSAGCALSATGLRDCDVDALNGPEVELIEARLDLRAVAYDQNGQLVRVDVFLC